MQVYAEIDDNICVILPYAHIYNHIAYVAYVACLAYLKYFSN